MSKYEPLVSIVCPIYNEANFISKCIDSILLQDYPQDKIEVFIIDGMSNDKTREIVAEYTSKFKTIRLLDNPKKIVPPALNLGIKESKGEVIVRLDGHCVYPENYISKLVENLYALDADNVGAVWNTLPAKNTPLCIAISIAVSHIFGVGNSLHKTGVNHITETDTVPFGCFKRNVFDKIGFFDEDLIRNQDDEFNARIIKSGGKIFLIPDLVIDYYARENISKMSKMFYQYGLFKPLVNKKLGQAATLRQFFPLLFLLGIVCGALLSAFSSIIAIAYLVVLFLYIFICFYFSFIEAVKNKKLAVGFYLFILFPIIHLSYGWGYLKGIVKLVFNKKFIVEASR